MNKFEEMCQSGEWFDFYGVDWNHFKLGNTVFLAEEDDTDGYRSYLRSVEVIEYDGLIFFDRPLARVKIVTIDTDRFALMDQDDHMWLEFGTEDYFDYYPMFFFSYKAKQS